MKPRHLLLICAAATLPLAMQAHAVEDTPQASAEFLDNDGEVVGHARIEQGPVGVIINLELSDLPEGWKAIHIHAKGECHDHEDGFQASGGHLNPDDAKHGFMNPEGPDAGDLPNFYVHDDGTAMAEMFNERVSLDGSVGANMMHEDGTALVIHEAPDDHMSQPIGGAGARIACGVVESDD
ncbi:superoxide dismutase family protein [Aquisalimonas asiatica]|uniref:Superoxide dismutase [Cu-Zn] n=1 Tax=Aquisalimonas asiatica TaxID=406100 RepID=A0A1H8R1R1_9GAMM|nr:superoxide dismutase family protein [Aquisalimonas asiatica]SEO60266.1 superoxide dismutase, Cu-Zn family [Aquisalimonas asiatica]